MYGVLVNPRRSFTEQDYYQGHPIDADDEPLLIDADFDEVGTDENFMTFNLPVDEY